MHKLCSRVKSYVNAPDTLLKIFHTPACQRLSQRQPYATLGPAQATKHEAKEVAVLGGGITGLAAAYYLSKELPNAKIVLLEGSSQLGGWVQTKSVNVANGKVVFEQGPRNLRPSYPAGVLTLNLVSELGLEHRLLNTSKRSAAAQNRFIYYPDHLVRMPDPGDSGPEVLWDLLTEPIFKGAFSGMIGEYSRPRPDNMTDESVGSFISRRLGQSILADNLLSAVLHGIYAGDVYKLSARSILPYLWMAECWSGSIAKNILERWIDGVGFFYQEDYNMVPKPQSSINVEDTSVFTFQGGIGELADAIVAKLQKNPKVRILKGTAVEGIELQRDRSHEKMVVTRTEYGTRKIKDDFTHVISTISGVNLHKIAGIFPLSLTPSVTVMVVNLFYSNPELLSVHGFGYLIPRSIPFTQNPECALGVVFDSESSVGQDTVTGTKITVMLGGHWWDGWSTYPDKEEGARMAKTVLKRHLGIEEAPTAIKVGLHKDCIPQYTVGHEERMSAASLLLEIKYKGRLRVAGSSYTGVGVNDCVRAARDIVKGLADGTGKNGLEMFVGGRQWVITRKRKIISSRSI